MYRASFRCIAGCHGTHPLFTPLYRCPTCGDLLEVAHDIEALKDRSAGAWMRLFDDRYKRTLWPYGSAVWGKKEWVCPDIRDDQIVSMDEGGTNLLWAERYGASPELHRRLMPLLVQAKRFFEVCELVEQEISWAKPEDKPRALMELADLRMTRLGDPEGALRAYQEALTLEPTQRSILATRAMAHIAQNFTREKMADETLNVYAELLEEKITPAGTQRLRQGHPPVPPLGMGGAQKMAAQ